MLDAQIGHLAHVNPVTRAARRTDAHAGYLGSPQVESPALAGGSLSVAWAEPLVSG